MVITLGQQYNVGEKPTVILYTYINRHAGTPTKGKTKQYIPVGNPFKYHVVDLYSKYLQPLKCILLLPCMMMYYTVLFLMFFWCPYMAIDVNVQYNGGFLPDIILLTRCYLHRGTCLNAMKRFCICSL